MMRSVSLVDRLELEFSGNHFSHGVCLGDVDGDGLNELVVGNVDGQLAIFRGDTDTKPWKKCLDLGMITSVTVGDVLNLGKNIVICSTAEGFCHLFNLQLNQSNGTTNSPESQSQTGTSMRPFHSQYISLNIKTLLIASIDSSGCHDLFLGYTDRAVGAYRWDNSVNSLVAITDRLPLAGQVGSLSVGLASSGTTTDCSSRGDQLLVAQAGGTYVPLVYTKKNSSDEDAIPVQLTYKKGSVEGTVGGGQIGNPTVGTEVLGNINTTPQKSPLPPVMAESGECSGRLTAICTLDGSIKLLKDEMKHWELQVDHSFFALYKLDITGSGGDEIVVCAWDGMTYIIDQKRNVVKYHVGENVCAFLAGHYGCGGHNVPCLVYTTFHNQILIYRNVKLPSIPSTNLLQAIDPNDFPVDVRTKWNTKSDLMKREWIHTSLYPGTQSS